jgi:hypothetical protein
MPDTYISKAIKKVISDTSEKINKPLSDIKRLDYNFDKAAKKGTLTKADIDSAKGQVLNIRRASDAIDIEPVEKVLVGTKTTVNTVKAGRTAALAGASLVNPAFGSSTEAIKAAETLIESSETAVQFGYESKDGIVQDSREVGNITTELAGKIDAYEKYLEESEGLSDELFQEEWVEYVANTQAHSFYSDMTGRQGVLRRDWIHKDPEKYKLVLEHAQLHGAPLHNHNSRETEDWALNQRVDAEIELNDIVRKWIRDRSSWWGLNKKVNDRMVQINNAGFGTEEAERLGALNRTDLNGMDELKGNIVDYRSEYDAWESVLLSLSNTSPQDLQVPGGGSIRSGRITQNEYNTTITRRQKDLLDSSVGATISLAFDQIYMKSILVDKQESLTIRSGGEVVEERTIEENFAVGTSELAGYEVFVDVQQVTTIDGRHETMEVIVIINRYGTQVI